MGVIGAARSPTPDEAPDPARRLMANPTLVKPAQSVPGRLLSLNVADVLNLTVSEAAAIFAADRDVIRALQPIVDVGLEYVRLGQPVPTLSGGEAQRLKLAGYLAQAARDGSSSRQPLARHGTLFMFDEPTTGLHFDDIAKLMRALRKLLDAGHSLLVIEHNLDVIRASDWLLDLGPEGGDAGGEVVAIGTPADLRQHPTSHTGKALRDYDASVGQGSHAAQEARAAWTQPGARQPIPQRRDQLIAGQLNEGQLNEGQLNEGQLNEGQLNRGQIPIQDSSAAGATQRLSKLDSDPDLANPLLPGASRERGINAIQIDNAKEHNLKSLSVNIPRDKFNVITGVSGSGKSTLAFDILFNEGQRRYLESLNAYARSIVQPAGRPEVDAVYSSRPRWRSSSACRVAGASRRWARRPRSGTFCACCT